VDKRERERVMREGGVGDPVAAERVDARQLAEDLEDSPLRGQPLRRRLRNFRPAVENYLASLSGPRPYMQRLNEIGQATERHEQRLAEACDALAAQCGGDDDAFARRWRRIAERWRFDDVNDLIERHNRFYPVESRLPMDPRTGDFVLLDGAHYVRRPLDAEWILERFPVEQRSAA
jgi:hypothetical protein